MKDEINLQADFDTFRSQIIEKFGEQYFEQTEIFFLRAVEQASQGLFVSAIASAEFALELSNYSHDKTVLPSLMGLLSQLHYKLGKINNAKTYYERGLKMLDPDDESFERDKHAYDELKKLIDEEGWKGRLKDNNHSIISTMKRPDIFTLKQCQAYVPADTDFAAYARLLQSKWRQEKGFPIGTYTNPRGETVSLGNYIEKNFAFSTAANFLSHNITTVVQDTLRTKEDGAKIFVDRLYTNLLSSQPLAFNLFGELSRNLPLATEVFANLFPGRIREIKGIRFEHSPGRGDVAYTADGSAFDVFIEYDAINGEYGFIGVEVKYSEALKDEPSSHKPRYEELTLACGLFKDGCVQFLQKKPIQQIWRDHLLSISLLRHHNRIYHQGMFMYLYPSENEECSIAVKKYIQHFKSFDSATEVHDNELTGFYPVCLKSFMLKLREFNKENWTSDLLQRYFDYSEPTL